MIYYGCFPEANFPQAHGNRARFEPVSFRALIWSFWPCFEQRRKGCRRKVRRALLASDQARLSQDVVYDLAFHVGQTEVSPTVTIGELRVIDSE
jgi:hypothetical protein